MTREFLERYQGILADIAAIKADKVTDRVRADMLQDWCDDLRAKQAYFINHLDKTRREEET